MSRGGDNKITDATLGVAHRCLAGTGAERTIPSFGRLRRPADGQVSFSLAENFQSLYEIMTQKRPLFTFDFSDRYCDQLLHLELHLEMEELLAI